MNRNKTPTKPPSRGKKATLPVNKNARYRALVAGFGLKVVAA